MKHLYQIYEKKTFLNNQIFDSKCFFSSASRNLKNQIKTHNYNRNSIKAHSFSLSFLYFFFFLQFSQQKVETNEQDGGQRGRREREKALGLPGCSKSLVYTNKIVAIVKKLIHNVEYAVKKIKILRILRWFLKKLSQNVDFLRRFSRDISQNVFFF